MARRKYRPYPTRKQVQNRRIRNIALVLIVLIAGVIILNQANKTKESPTSDTTSQTDNIRPVSLGDILPERSQPSAEPEVVTNPAVEQSEPAVPTPAEAVVEISEQAEVSQPESISEPVQLADDQTSPEAAEMIRQAVQLRDEEGKIIAARELLNRVLMMELSPSVRAEVKHQLSKLADQWLFGPKVHAEDKLTSYYLVQPGDLLEKIAKHYKVPYEIIMQINDIIRPELLRAGQKIKVIHGPFKAVVYKDSFTMDLYLQNRYVKTYRVGLGKDTYETPTGRWRVASGGKMIRPSWTDPDTSRTYDGTDPDYPLGSRWIALEGLEGDAEGQTGFAIHGTKDENTIGTRSSRGCIRLYNGDVVEVYDLLYGGVSEVFVRD